MQQATCAHSGANPVASSGNIDHTTAPSRRALLGFAGVGALALTVGGAAHAALSETGDRVAWDHAMQAFLSAVALADACTAANTRNPKPTEAELENEDRLINAMLDAEGCLMKLPAPDIAALAWKLDRLLVDEDGATPSWSFDYAEPVLRDARRLAA